MTPPTVSTPEYWNDLYKAGDNGWNKGVVAPPILRLLKEGVVPPGASVGVIGAGFGHEAHAAAALGFNVTAIDFAPEAVKEMRASNPPFEVLQADLFTMHRSFTAVLEHTCFCAIDVQRRDEYVDAVARSLKPGGVLFGLFYAHGREGGPPFDTNDAEVRERFARRFELERLRVAPDSFEARAGKELEFVFRLRAT